MPPLGVVDIGDEPTEIALGLRERPVVVEGDLLPFERFFKTLKREEVSLHHSRRFTDAEVHVGRFIGVVSNAKRRHSRLGYLPPIECEDDSFALRRS